MDYFKPSRTECNQRAKEGSPGSPALPEGSSISRGPTSTHTGQSENQVETRPHVWGLALRWQITLYLSPSESWGQILRPQAFISTKFPLLCHLPGVAFRFSSPRRRRSNQGVLGCKLLMLDTMDNPGPACSSPLWNVLWIRALLPCSAPFTPACPALIPTGIVLPVQRWCLCPPSALQNLLLLSSRSAFPTCPCPCSFKV